MKQFALVMFLVAMVGFEFVPQPPIPPNQGKVPPTRGRLTDLPMGNEIEKQANGWYRQSSGNHYGEPLRWEQPLPGVSSEPHEGKTKNENSKNEKPRNENSKKGIS